jgi:hypothetical protein
MIKISTVGPATTAHWLIETIPTIILETPLKLFLCFHRKKCLKMLVEVSWTMPGEVSIAPSLLMVKLDPENLGQSLGMEQTKVKNHKCSEC